MCETDVFFTLPSTGKSCLRGSSFPLWILNHLYFATKLSWVTNKTPVTWSNETNYNFITMIRVENFKLRKYNRYLLKSAKIFTPFLPPSAGHPRSPGSETGNGVSGSSYVSVINVVFVSFSEVCCSFWYLLVPWFLILSNYGEHNWRCQLQLPWFGYGIGASTPFQYSGNVENLFKRTSCLNFYYRWGNGFGGERNKWNSTAKEKMENRCHILRVLFACGLAWLWVGVALVNHS